MTGKYHTMHLKQNINIYEAYDNYFYLNYLFESENCITGHFFLPNLHKKDVLFHF